MDVTIWGGNFEDVAAPAVAEQQPAVAAPQWAPGIVPPPPLVIPPFPQEEFDEPAEEEQVQQQPAIEQPLPPIGQLGLYDEDPLSDEEDGPIS
jgi:hypothetical protein